MVPKTKLQVEVWRLHKNLPDPKHHEPYIISRHDFYYTTHYKNLVCLECNHSWKPDFENWAEKVAGVKCPSCNKKLKKINTDRGMATFVFSYSIAEVVDRFQVIRYFECRKHMDKNKEPRYSFYSLFEEWKDWDKNKEVIVGRTGTYYGGFSNSDYEVRYINKTSWRGSIYESFSSDFNCPNPEFIPRFKKYGLKTSNTYDCDFRKLLRMLEVDSKVETLLKSKQKELLIHAIYKGHDYSRYWNQVKQVMRHKYKLKDAGIWFDYLELLQYFRKDLNNPKFVLPDNLHKAHNELMMKKRKRLEIERAQREIIRQEEERIKAEKDKALRGIKKELFKNVSFSSGPIKVVSLVEEEEVKKEGDILNHCVYTNNYINKKGILLMSARIDNKPIETLEISLSSFKIIQCRGFDNDPTEYHDQIVNIVKKNMNKIAKIIKNAKVDINNPNNQKYNLAG